MSKKDQGQSGGQEGSLTDQPNAALQEVRKIQNDIAQSIVRLEGLPEEVKITKPYQGALHSLGQSLQSLNNLQLKLLRSKSR
ncbi:hypothetical protein SAMN05216302_101464 [Nitrosomonas aestuarii]|uniref:Uncharacterized protein n=1 Tax=Nitrosomonas aestuarii TaxID=52441 RepID=A0A1I4C2D0_9PROT|nr:hypothetical protein SAMN05216302_101464 [Nitrosomonas aestuarii]